MDTKKLRQKILDLAIHGKLVPQDPNDEPASVLLERIREEKDRLIKEGKIKKTKSTASSDTSHYENVPFELPEGWSWTTIGEVSSSILYGVSESAKETGAYKLLRITDIQDNKVNWDSVPYTDFDKDKALNYLLQDGDILFARTGATVGKSYLVSGLTKDSIYASYLIRVQTSQLIFPEYIKRFFESGYYWEQISLSSVGIGQPNVNGTTLANLNVPIPPYKEQLRIVEETNRWLAIADFLDENTGHVCKVIESAKAKILDLAIHGKLVPQNANDEPASELLKRINPKAAASCDNPQYGKVPSSWVISTVGEVFTINPKTHVEDDTDAAFVPMTCVSDGYSNTFEYECRKWGDIKKGFVHFQENDVAVAKISPCLENRKSVVFHDLPNGIGAGTTELNVFRCEEILPEYALFYFKSQMFIGSCAGTYNGVVGQQRVAKSFIQELPIGIPPYNEQLRIVSKVNELFSQLDMIEKSLQA